MVFPRPGGRQSAALLNGSVDAWATWEPTPPKCGEDQRGQILVSGKGLLPGNTFLRQRIPRLTIRKNAPRCRIISSARPALSAGPTPISTATAKRWGDHLRFPAEIARAQFANRQSQWQPLAEETVTQQQATADFISPTA